MFQPVTIDSGPSVADSVLEILEAAIESVDPRRAVASAIEWDGHTIEVAGCALPIPGAGIRVIALGKAAVEMTWGVSEALPGTVVTGIAATPHPLPAPPGIEVVEGAHPTPDRRSVIAGHRLMEAATSTRPGDVVLVLVSGGGSACAEIPADGLSVEHLAATSDALLAAGVPIGETNTVRRALSLFKGGALAAACAPAKVVTLVVSDVVGNDLATIAGGPTISNPTGHTDALAVIEDHGLETVIGPAVMAYLRREAAPRHPNHETPVAIVADAGAAALGALAAATRLGIAAEIVDTTITGEARFVGQRLAGVARISRPLLSIFAGETTVIVKGTGSGGRNQEVALAAALALQGAKGSLVASVGTDGVDGPTTAAGGVVDGGTIERGMQKGLDAGEALAANDSGTYLEGVGGRLVCGPTGTNVGDVMLAWGR